MTRYNINPRFVIVTAGERPTSGYPTGSLLWDTDSLYTFNGTSWDKILGKDHTHSEDDIEKLAVVLRTSTANVFDNNFVILADATGAPITLTLPAANNRNGQQHSIIKVDSTANAVIIDANASETINGSATYSLTAQYQAVTLVCDGSNWFVLQSANPTAAAVGSIDDLTDADTTTTPPVINHVLTWDGSNWVPAAAPGASGGEANTLSNVGTGGISVVASPAKTGTALNVKSIAALSSRVSIADDATNKNVDIDVVEGQLNIANQTGSIGDSRITDLAYSKLTSVPSTFTPSAHQHAVTDLSPTGTALQVVRTNAAGTAVEWASLDSERTGKAVGDGGSTQYVIAHGLGSTPSYAFIDCSTHSTGRTWVVDATNITVTFDATLSGSTDAVNIYWRVIA
ncbi:MAG: hypothetical protein L0H53_03865 [Candidatus Nitrosocosmicus sp.]|nr:hypothetical protein [Candidatus Nitrosocosmicus sp.]MDN5866237.1 hypothetical protein [Candidatus Nitrosocosmicus sp.]